MPKLFRVILPVSDIALAEKFYSQILATPGKRISPGRHYFDCEGTILACYDPKPTATKPSFPPTPTTFISPSMISKPPTPAQNSPAANGSSPPSKPAPGASVLSMPKTPSGIPFVSSIQKPSSRAFPEPRTVTPVPFDLSRLPHNIPPMAYTEPVLTKRIDADPDKRKIHWYDDYVATGGYAASPKSLGNAAR